MVETVIILDAMTFRQQAIQKAIRAQNFQTYAYSKWEECPWHDLAANFLLIDADFFLLNEHANKIQELLNKTLPLLGILASQEEQQRLATNIATADKISWFLKPVIPLELAQRVAQEIRAQQLT